MIGYHMRMARMEAGMSQADLATDAGISYRSLQSYEQGLTQPGIVNLVSLADALGISIDDYIGHRIGGEKR